MSRFFVPSQATSLLASRYFTRAHHAWLLYWLPRLSIRQFKPINGRSRPAIH